MKLEAGLAAVVTGGASGLGRASAQALADAGFKVAIFDINDEDGEAHVFQLRQGEVVRPGAVVCVVVMQEDGDE